MCFMNFYCFFRFDLDDKQPFMEFIEETIHYNQSYQADVNDNNDDKNNDDADNNGDHEIHHVET